MLKNIKKGFNRLVESSSSSMTTLAKKYMNNENVVKNRRDGNDAMITYSQYKLVLYLVIKIIKEPIALTIY
jgi:hypothetical protein